MRTEQCVVCGEGTVHEDSIFREDYPFVELKFFTGCTVCEVDYADAEISEFNAAQMRKHLDKHPEDDPRLTTIAHLMRICQ